MSICVPMATMAPASEITDSPGLSKVILSIPKSGASRIWCCIFVYLRSVAANQPWGGSIAPTVWPKAVGLRVWT